MVSEMVYIAAYQYIVLNMKKCDDKVSKALSSESRRKLRSEPQTCIARPLQALLDTLLFILIAQHLNIDGF